ncbi:hypothetical protein V2J09_011121 [Rumex salicifolius]
MGKRKPQVDDAEYYGGSYYYNPRPPPPPPPPPPLSRQWFPWFIPAIFVVDVSLFVYSMYVEDCPQTFHPAEECLFTEYLGRYAFLPATVNPLLGPSTHTLDELGGLMLEQVQNGEAWRLFTCIWLHAGAIHLMSNMLSLLFVGISLEKEFGFWRLGPLYVITGVGGSLSSCLHILELNHGVAYVSVGASGALFGLLGSMLSELITNWTIYANKCASISSLITIIVINLAFGLLPGVDNSAHVGGFVSGFLLGFVLLMRPQYGYISQKYLPMSAMSSSSKNKSKHISKYKCYQHFLFILALLTLIFGYATSFVKLLGSSLTLKAPR